jgi:hypothetical protein
MSAPQSPGPPAPGLGRRGRWVRGIATVAVLAVLAVGQALDTNDLFPLGSLSQYATARDLNGEVRAVTLTADTADRTAVPIRLDQRTVGVGRAEIEGQLGRIVDDPSLLQSLADAYEALHPDRPPLLELRLHRSTRDLADGRVVGEPTLELLAGWNVVDQAPVTIAVDLARESAVSQP